nr:hypothetical protein [Tanacetum cinerariifolium]
MENEKRYACLLDVKEMLGQYEATYMKEHHRLCGKFSGVVSHTMRIHGKLQRCMNLLQGGENERPTMFSKIILNLLCIFISQVDCNKHPISKTNHIFFLYTAGPTSRVSANAGDIVRLSTLVTTYVYYVEQNGGRFRPTNILDDGKISDYSSRSNVG